MPCMAKETRLPSTSRYNISPCRMRHKIPSVILQQSIMFLHHSYLPIGISQSAAVGLQFGRQSGGM